MHDLVDPARRHTDRHSQLVLCDPETLDEFLHQDLSRMDWVDQVILSGSQRVRHCQAPPSVHVKQIGHCALTGILSCSLQLPVYALHVLLAPDQYSALIAERSDHHAITYRDASITLDVKPEFD